MQTVTTNNLRSDENTLLHGHWLIVVRVAWIVSVALTLVIFFACIPVYITQLETICSGTGCAYRQLSLEQATALHAGGFSLANYAAYNVVLVIISEVVFFTISLVIFWRKSNDWLALLFTLALILFGTVFVTETVAASHSIWSTPTLFLNELAFVSLYLIAALFPDGRFVPRWTRWLILGYIGIAVWRISILLSDSSPDLNRYPLIILLFWFVVTLSLGIAQVHRYRQVSNPVQRQQTKWIVYSLLFSIVVGFGLEFPTLIFPSLNILYNIFATTLTTIVVLLIPLSVGFAILRYRLWDIDVLMNRTLVYSSLSIILALIYAGCVCGMQLLFQALTWRSSSQLIVVVSTLIIAALFQPLRHRLQRVIDRRFYRRKYDAAKTLKAFSMTLQGELDLAQLHEQLVAVVQETMQPSHISLWLSKPKATTEYFKDEVHEIAQ
jgi:hypothetical protein